MDSHELHPVTHEHKHTRKPIDQGYRLIVRTVLWIIAGTVFVAFGVWWFLT